MSYHVLKAPLIIDPDWEFLNSLGNEPAPRNLQPWLAGDKDRAFEILLTESSWVSCIVVNPSIGAAAVSDLIRYANENLFGMQIYFLSDPAKTKADNESRAMIARQILEKPLTYEAILQWVDGLNRPPKRVRNRGRVTARDADFSSIAAKDVLVGGALSIDVYIRLREDRYVRVVAAGDALDEYRLLRYLKRGLTDFYTKTADRDEYLRLCENLSSMLNAQRRPEAAA